jgi:DNA modification methylase
MEIKNVLVKDIKYAPYNPRKISDEVLSKLKRSIEEFGYIEPIIINKRTMHVVGGNQRLKVLRQLDIKEVQAVIVDLDDTHEKALNIALNKISGEWDLPLLKDLLLEIDTGEIDTEITGFDMPEIEELMNQFHIEGEEDNFNVDEAVEEIKEPTTKTGDIWLLGKHRVMCGDATKKEDVERLMDGKKADMVFTDPPYGVNYEGINNDEESGLEELLLKSFKNYSENMKKGSPIYVFHADRTAHIFHNVFRKFFHFSSMLVWVKPALVLSQTDYQSRHEPCLYGWEKNGTHNWYADRKQTTVLEIGKERVDGHTTPKPLEFIGVALRNSSRKGDIVLDLFGGSGSTLIACEQLNRTCYMMELDPKYCDVIIKRWEDFTGQKAILEE